MLIKSISDAKRVLEHAGYTVEVLSDEYGQEIRVIYGKRSVQLYTHANFTGVMKPSEVIASAERARVTPPPCPAGTVQVSVEDALNIF